MLMVTQADKLKPTTNVMTAFFMFISLYFARAV